MFFFYSTSPGVGRVSPDLARTRQQRVIQHRRMRSLPVPTCITRTCSTDRLVVKDDIVKVRMVTCYTTAELVASAIAHVWSTSQQ